MIHHVSLGTNDVKKARAFYNPVLAVLGLPMSRRSDMPNLEHDCDSPYLTGAHAALTTALALWMALSRLKPRASPPARDPMAESIVCGYRAGQ